MPFGYICFPDSIHRLMMVRRSSKLCTSFWGNKPTINRSTVDDIAVLMKICMAIRQLNDMKTHVSVVIWITIILNVIYSMVVTQLHLQLNAQSIMGVIYCDTLYSDTWCMWSFTIRFFIVFCWIVHLPVLIKQKIKISHNIYRYKQPENNLMNRFVLSAVNLVHEMVLYFATIFGPVLSHNQL